MKKFKTIIFLGISVFGLAQRPAPAPAQKNPIAITNTTIHTGNGNVLQNASIVFENGKITQINGTIPSDAEVINAQNKYVYPGFILVNNTLGLVEIEATRATDDTQEANDITPEVRSLISFNTDSHVIPTVRTNGVLLTQPVLKSGTISCTSSIMNLDGWNWEDAVEEKDNAIHMSWPTISTRFFDEKREAERKEMRAKKLEELKSLFKNVDIFEIDERELRKISFLQNPKDSVAVCSLETAKIDDSIDRQIILDGIQDPGNLGTIIRLADWFGIEQVVCSQDTVDLYNPKVLMSTMGSFARVNVCYVELEDYLKIYQHPIIGTDMQGESIYKKEFPSKFSLVLGNEGNGIRPSVEQLLTDVITIPRFGKQQSTESLNVSMATGIILGQIFSDEV